jgi:hypothetical protein
VCRPPAATASYQKKGVFICVYKRKGAKAKGGRQQEGGSGSGKFFFLIIHPHLFTSFSLSSMGVCVYVYVDFSPSPCMDAVGLMYVFYFSGGLSLLFVGLLMLLASHFSFLCVHV